METIFTDFDLPVTNEQVEKTGIALSRRYPFFSLRSIGKSYLQKEIYLFSIGEGEQTLLYVAGHHALETVCSAVLLRFATELCREAEQGRSVYDCSTEYLLRYRRICILPLLNPDGASILRGEIDGSHPMYERLLAMNDGSDDFCRWQANGRGVDLNHNYDAGFSEYRQIERQMGIYKGAPTRYSGEYPESESEVASLCAFVRNNRPRFSLSLHSQGEEIYFGKPPYPPALLAIGKRIARMTGYSISVPTGGAAYGGMTDWMIEKEALPCYTLECGKGVNPLPSTAVTGIYGRLRPLLFRAPILFCSNEKIK